MLNPNKAAPTKFDNFEIKIVTPYCQNFLTDIVAGCLKRWPRIQIKQHSNGHISGEIH